MLLLLLRSVAWSADLPAAQQFQVETLTEVHPTAFVTLLTTLVELPPAKEAFSVLNLRTYYDQSVSDSSLWQPRSAYVRSS